MRRASWGSVAASYVGAVVGAGFGSGREIVHFFAAHGATGLLGAGLSGVLFAWLGAAALRRGVAEGLPHYGALLRRLCGRALGAALDRLATVFLLLTVVVVLAGGGALGVALGGRRWEGASGVAGLLLAGAWGGRRGHLALSGTLVAVLVALALWSLVRTLAAHPPALLLATPAWRPRQPSWALHAVLYVAFNLVLGLAGLCAGVPAGESPQRAARGAAVGGATLGLLCLAATAALLPLRPTALHAELPLRAALPARGAGAAAFPLSLLAALWTTGSAALAALAQRLPAVPPRLGTLCLVALALPPSLLGLAWLVAVVYPLMGYAGLPLLACLAAEGVRGWWPRCGAPPR